VSVLIRAYDFEIIVESISEFQEESEILVTEEEDIGNSFDKPKRKEILAKVINLIFLQTK
jgi:hypothetical protein